MVALIRFLGQPEIVTYASQVLQPHCVNMALNGSAVCADLLTRNVASHRVSSMNDACLRILNAGANLNNRNRAEDIVSWRSRR